jgi:hypothetical protein
MTRIAIEVIITIIQKMPDKMLPPNSEDIATIRPIANPIALIAMALPPSASDSDGGIRYINRLEPCLSEIFRWRLSFAWKGEAAPGEA